MQKSGELSQQPAAKAQSGISTRDEAARRLLEACRSHYPPPKYEVACDSSHIVWIKDKRKKRSVGLQPWLLRDHTLDEVLERADTKLGVIN